MAHDSNNIVGVIAGYGQIVLKQFPAGDPLKDKMEQILKAADRAAGLTRQLLAFSRKQVLQPKVLDLNVVVLDMDEMLQRLIGEDVELLTALDPHLGSVKADRGQIEQIIMNLHGDGAAGRGRGMLRDMLQETLEGSGYTVLVARNGTEAPRTAEAKAGPIQLMVTDVIMPGLTGPKAVERIAPVPAGDEGPLHLRLP